MKKAIAATVALAMLGTTPAFAWHPITITNATDPVLIREVTFTAPPTNAVSFVVNVPVHQSRTFGPVPEDGGPCLRTLIVEIITSYGGAYNYTAPTKMNVCTETWINVGFAHVYPGGDKIIITHGGPAGAPISGTGGSGISGSGNH
jgi:hypothetical protein